MERNTFEAVHGYMHSFPPQSGDAMLSRTFWFMLALAPTDPGALFPTLPSYHRCHTCATLSLSLNLAV